MITDDELLNLPDDPELAFIQYETVLRERIITNIDQSDGYGVDEYKIEYISHVLGVAKALDLQILDGWSVPSSNSTSNAIDQDFKQLLTDVGYYTVQIRIKNARRIKKYSVSLDPAAKMKIRHHLEKIKEFVDRLDASDKKKEVLYSKITALENEVNRDRTRFDAVMALILEGAETGGEAGKRLKPFRELLDSVTGVLKAAKEIEESESPRLSAPETPKQIPPPKKQLPPPDESGSSGDLDDEIPF